MHFRSKAQQGHRSKHHEPADRMPSTAWLAAQAAFSAPQPVQAQPAVVVVHKSKPAAMGWGADQTDAADAADAASSASAAAGAPEYLERPARVFLVAPAPAGDSAAAPLQDRAPAAEKAPPAVALRPRRRLHADKRPGPVLHITQPTPERAARDVSAAPRGPTIGEQIASLQAMVAEVNTVLEHIQRARGLQFLASAAWPEQRR
jgi:hypothetical protein